MFILFVWTPAIKSVMRTKVIFVTNMENPFRINT